tara:strand:- start:2530 stop:2724 length:195 start_codon:yes stop_codon:yes gene_type:complete
LKKLVKRLKELQKFDIAVTGDIATILENPREWALGFAENEIVEQLSRYNEAKKLGEEFAREITD